MKKGQLYEGTIETIEFPNKGILTYKEEDREYKVVIKGTLPGQKVRFQLSKKHSGKCEGRLVEVLEPSELEDREPLCPHYESAYWVSSSLSRMAYPQAIDSGMALSAFFSSIRHFTFSIATRIVFSLPFRINTQNSSPPIR